MAKADFVPSYTPRDPLLAQLYNVFFGGLEIFDLFGFSLGGFGGSSSVGTVVGMAEEGVSSITLRTSSLLVETRSGAVLEGSTLENRSSFVHGCSNIKNPSQKRSFPFIGNAACKNNKPRVSRTQSGKPRHRKPRRQPPTRKPVHQLPARSVEPEHLFLKTQLQGAGLADALPPLPRTDMKIIICPAPGLILRKLQTHQVARAIVEATGGAQTCKGDDFIRLRPGSNIIIVSTPHEGTAATLMKIMSLTFHGRSHPVKVYLSTPEDLLKGVVHGIDVGTSEEELMANLRVRTHGVRIVKARMLGQSQTALLHFEGPQVPRFVYFYGGDSEREDSDSDYSESSMTYRSRSGSSPRSRFRSCSQPRPHFRSPRRRSQSTPKQQQQGAPIIAAPKDKGSQQNQRKTKEASPKRTNTKEQESIIDLQTNVDAIQTQMQAFMDATRAQLEQITQTTVQRTEAAIKHMEAAVDSKLKGHLHSPKLRKTLRQNLCKVTPAAGHHRPQNPSPIITSPTTTPNNA
ncbi:hypothetical protein HPB49_003108 [Dermacentor silvarum]|uniref:Uncharacterized protein n=1 Tax=Dermacentor silvarum TaxID=543639 RepID=A0ACB8DAI5_DERSI|nr:hypothetical protein HPB49_003108 [Dermacentor silvarum]